MCGLIASWCMIFVAVFYSAALAAAAAARMFLTRLRHSPSPNIPDQWRCFSCTRWSKGGEVIKALSGSRVSQ